MKYCSLNEERQAAAGVKEASLMTKASRQSGDETKDAWRNDPPSSHLELLASFGLVKLSEFG